MASALSSPDRTARPWRSRTSPRGRLLTLQSRDTRTRSTRLAARTLSAAAHRADPPVRSQSVRQPAGCSRTATSASPRSGVRRALGTWRVEWLQLHSPGPPRAPQPGPHLSRPSPRLAKPHESHWTHSGLQGDVFYFVEINPGSRAASSGAGRNHRGLLPPAGIGPRCLPRGCLRASGPANRVLGGQSGAAGGQPHSEMLPSPRTAAQAGPASPPPGTRLPDPVSHPGPLLQGKPGPPALLGVSPALIGQPSIT